MQNNYKSEIMGGILIVFSLFLLLTNTYPETTGIFGSFTVNYFILPLFGKVLYVLPVFIALAGLFLISVKNISNVKRRAKGIFWLIINICVFVEIFMAPETNELIWPAPLTEGGFIGYLLFYVLRKYFGAMGAYLLLVATSFYAVFMIFDGRLGDIGRLLFYSREERLIRTRPNEPESKPAPVTAVRYQQKKVSEEKKDFIKNLKKMFDFSTENQEPDILTATQKMPPRNNKNENVPLKNNNLLTDYKIPPLSLLNFSARSKETARNLQQQVEQDKLVLETTLHNFNVEAKVVHVSHGPAVTRYELMPAPGVRVNKIANLANDISLAMAATVRIEAPIPGKSVVGIEVPNRYTRPVFLSELTENEEFLASPLTVALGLDIGGTPVYGSLNEMPHLLIAGATGSGKSVCINSIIMSILLKASPAEVNFLMIDPKRVELQPFNDLPHLIAPVVHEPQLAHVVLKTWAVKEMEMRYKIFAKAGVRNIEGFNAYARRNRGKTIVIDIDTSSGRQQMPYVVEHMPYTVIIIDELADLMMVASRDVEGVICRLAQMARATGIHLVIATQRPSVDVITGLIKANIPSRIAFAVGSQVDSRTIIDGMGAETLLGKGDMLYSPVGARHLRRVQGVYVGDSEVNKVTNFIRRQGNPTYQIDLNLIEQEAAKQQNKKSGGLNLNTTGNQRDDGRDILFDDAAKMIQETGKKSISYIQRRFRIGYNRAARIMDELVAAGVVNTQQ